MLAGRSWFPQSLPTSSPRHWPLVTVGLSLPTLFYNPDLRLWQWTNRQTHLTGFLLHLTSQILMSTALLQIWVMTKYNTSCWFLTFDLRPWPTIHVEVRWSSTLMPKIRVVDQMDEAREQARTDIFNVYKNIIPMFLIREQKFIWIRKMSWIEKNKRLL